MGNDPTPEATTPPLDPKGKYWVIQRTADYYAAWRQENPDRPAELETNETFLCRLWDVRECYTDHADQSPTTGEWGESYSWAKSLSRDNALAIARMFAEAEGGTPWEVGGVSKGFSDPNTYNDADWS